MIKIHPSNRIIRRVTPKVKPSASTPYFFHEPEKSNPVIKHTFIAKIGGLENVGYGMNRMNWVDKKSFDSIEEAMAAVKEFRRASYIGCPNEIIIEEEIVYADRMCRTNTLKTWKKKSMFEDWKLQ
tara:strand:+ start:1617 stop:1994 length:378 start_codon:yes stop_codon:yes gene_type:complete